MSEEMAFFMYLIEHYAHAKQRSTAEVFDEWKAHQIIDKIFDSYWVYHTERIENAFEDIDRMMEN